MKTLKFILIAIAVSITSNHYAQDMTAEEVINTYFENTGGIDAWKSIKGLKLSAKLNQGGMEIPIDIYQMSDGRTATIINLQGQQFKQNVFDGEVMWAMNFQTMKAEKMDAETTANAKLDLNDFPDPFIDWKEKGYAIEMMGMEEFQGSETIKIKLTMEPYTVEGKEEENVAFYFFDPENFVPIARQSEIKIGQAKGIISEATFSDYQEVGDVYMPFSITQGSKGGPSQPITFESIEIIEDADASIFAFPEEAPAEEGDDKNKN